MSTPDDAFREMVALSQELGLYDLPPGAAVDADPDDAYSDDDPRCTHCEGEVWVECDDPIQCCDPRCDGEFHPDPACGGTGLAEHQVIW